MADLTTPGGAAVQDDQYELFVIEQRGIDYIPSNQRHARPVDLFWMWLGTVSGPFYLIYGSLIIVTGLNFAQAAVLIVLGNIVSFIPLGLASLPGPAAGTGTFAISRAAYGPNANRAVGILNWLTLLGYESTDLAVIVLAVLAMTNKFGLGESTTLKVVVMLLALALQLPLPLYGHATIVKSLRVLSYIFVPGAVILAILIAPKVQFTAGHPAGFVAITMAVALVFSGGGLGWTAQASDFSRYIPATASRWSVFTWTALAGMVPAIGLELIGAAVTTTVPTASDLISGLPSALPGWFVIPFLILVILSVYAGNTLDLYSSGLTLQAIGVRIRRWQAVCVDLVVSGIALFVIIFSQRFNTLLTEFLLLQLIWVTPWATIYITDYVLRRGRYDPISLLQSFRGLYWRNGGVHVPAVAAQIAGSIAAALWINTPAFVGPLSNRVGGADFNIIASAVVAAVVYVALAYRTVLNEARAAREPRARTAQPT
jgi:nucleobase:cation symporter-1, NCS1 family